MATKIQFVVDAQDRTKAALSAANRRLNVLKATAGRVTSSMGGMHAKIGLLIGTAGLGALTAKSFKTIDALAKTADSLGMTTQKLAGLQHAANVTGVSSDGLNKALQRMQQGLGQVAATGTGEAKNALDKLGLSIEDIKDLKPDEQFKLIASSLKTVETQSEKVYIAQALLGRNGRALINTMNLGAEGVQALQEEAEKLGIAVNRLDAAKIEAANDAFDRAKKAAEGVGNKIAFQISPVVKVLSDRFVEAATNGENMGITIKNAFTGAGNVVGWFQDALHGLRITYALLDVGMRTWIGFGVSGIAAMANGIVSLSNTIRTFIVEQLQPMIGLANRLNLLPKEMVAGWKEFANADIKPPQALMDFSRNFNEGILNAKSQLYELLASDLPSAVIKQQIAGILEQADAEAKIILAKVNDNIGNQYTDEGDDAGDNKDKEQAEKSHLDKMANLQLGSSKKIAAIQKALKLKTAIMNTYTGISEAVASAPFPMNIPAIAFATAEGFAAITAIKGARQHGGPVDGGSSYIVGEKGREVFTPTVSGIITSNSDANKMGGGSTSINYSPTINSTNPQDALDILAKDRKRFGRMVNSVLGVPA